MPQAIRGALRRASTRVGARAVGPPNMIDAKGQGRRRKGDAGPLRKLSGRLARVVADSRQRGGIAAITQAGDVFTLEKGGDPFVVPEFVNEVGTNNLFGRGITLPKRPFLAPALDAERPAAERDAQRAVLGVLRRAIAGTLAAAALSGDAR